MPEEKSGGEDGYTKANIGHNRADSVLPAIRSNSMTPPSAEPEIDHLAFSILHGTFNPDSPGGCSCDTCQAIRKRIEELREAEAAKFYNEHYPPPGGLL